MSVRAAPEDLQERFAVWNDLVQGEEGVAVNGHGISLHAEVATQLHIEAHLHTDARTCSNDPYTQIAICTAVLKHAGSTQGSVDSPHLPVQK